MKFNITSVISNWVDIKLLKLLQLTNNLTNNLTMSSTIINNTFNSTILALVSDNEDVQVLITQLLEDKKEFLICQCNDLSKRLETKGKPLPVELISDNIGKVVIGTDKTNYTVVKYENKKASKGFTLQFRSCDDNGVAKESTSKTNNENKPDENVPLFEVDEEGNNVPRLNVPGKNATLWNSIGKINKIKDNKTFTTYTWKEKTDKKVSTKKSKSTMPEESSLDLEIGTLSKGSRLNGKNEEEYWVVSFNTLSPEILQNRWLKISTQQWNTQIGETITKGDKKWLVKENEEGDKCWELM